MNALARYENQHNHQHNQMNRQVFGMPTIFDIFSRPLADFENMFTPMREDNIRLDVQDCGDHYQIKADMPGVKKDDIKLDFDDGNLTISAEHHSEKEKKDNDGYILKERSSGTYKRTLYFNDADADQINAAFAGGELDIRIDKKKVEEKKTSIKIH